MNKYILYILFCLSVLSLKAQEDTVIPFDSPYHNSLKFNRFLVNPTFSFVREDYSYISFFHRNQWFGFDNSPRTYLVNYSGKIDDRSGAGIGLYQQKLGIFTNFGAMVNYAYDVKFNEKNSLTFGFNLAYFNNGIDAASILIGQDDPALQKIGNSSFMALQPGINLKIGTFDFGVYAENLVVFNLKKSDFSKQAVGQSFTGHIMYTQFLNNTGGLFTDAKLSILARGKLKEKTKEEENFNLSVSSIFDMPKLGWAQVGYNDFYGIAAGIGFNLSGSLSLGYNYEKGLKNGISSLGATHEIVFAYSFKSKNEAKQDNSNKEKVDPLEQAEKDPIVKKRKTAKLTVKNDSISKDGTISGKIENSAMIQVDNDDDLSTVAPENKSIFSAFTMSSKKTSNTIKKQNFEGVQGGYYLIGNVYEKTSNLNYFLGILESKGIVSAGYFTDQRTNLNYAYLKRYDTLDEAKADYQSKMNNVYDGPMWILHVDKTL